MTIPWRLVVLLVPYRWRPACSFLHTGWSVSHLPGPVWASTTPCVESKVEVVPRRNDGEATPPVSIGAEADTITGDEDASVLLQGNLAHGPWANRFAELLAFRREHGHCRVPKRYAANKSLANWVSKQRQIYRKLQTGEIRTKSTSQTQARIAALEQIGFCWNTLTDNSTQAITASKVHLHSQSESLLQWHQNYQSLQNYMAQHNLSSVNELLPSSKFETWIKRQRQNYLRDEKGPLDKRFSQEQLNLLHQLDPHWHMTRHEYMWELRFQDLVAYAVENGHCCVPISHSNRKLAHWVSNQRKMYSEQLKGKRNSLCEHRKQRLEDVGFVWNRWEYEFQQKHVVEGSFVEGRQYSPRHP